MKLDKIYFARNLKKYRKIKNLTQTELAKMLEMKANSISQWEAGNRSPGSLEQIIKVADVLGIPLEQLLSNSADTSESKNVHEYILEMIQSNSVQEMYDYSYYMLSKEEQENAVNELQTIIGIYLNHLKK